MAWINISRDTVVNVTNILYTQKTGVSGLHIVFVGGISLDITCDTSKIRDDLLKRIIQCH